MERSLPPPPKKPPPTPPKGGEYLCAHERIRTLDTFSDNFCKNTSKLVSPPFGGVGGDFLGRLPLLHRYALHVTFLLMVICRGQGERKFIIIYNIYIIFYNLFTLKIYILLLFVLLCLFLPLNSTNFIPLLTCEV